MSGSPSLKFSLLPKAWMSDTVALGNSSLDVLILLCHMKCMSPGKLADIPHEAPRDAVHQRSQSSKRVGLLSNLLSCSRQMENILNSSEMV